MNAKLSTFAGDYDIYNICRLPNGILVTPRCWKREEHMVTCTDKDQKIYSIHEDTMVTLEAIPFEVVQEYLENHG